MAARTVLEPLILATAVWLLLIRAFLPVLGTEAAFALVVCRHRSQCGCGNYCFRCTLYLFLRWYFVTSAAGSVRGQSCSGITSSNLLVINCVGTNIVNHVEYLSSRNGLHKVRMAKINDYILAIVLIPLHTAAPVGAGRHISTHPCDVRL